MFYKHWKKLALALTAFLGVSCSSDAEPMYGCNSSICYNSTTETPSGKIIDIVECDSRSKFLRHPKLYYEDPEVRDMIDQEPFFYENAPLPNEPCGSSNCKFIGEKICYDASYNDESGNVHSYNNCVATVDCPEKK